MKRSLFALTLILMLSAVPAVAADSSVSVSASSGSDGMSDLPSRITAWYSGQWRNHAIFTGVWTSGLVLLSLYAVSDSFRNRVRAAWGKVSKVFTGSGQQKCGCGKPQKCSSCGGKPPKKAVEGASACIAKRCPFFSDDVNEQAEEAAESFMESAQENLQSFTDQPAA